MDQPLNQDLINHASKCLAGVPSNDDNHTVAAAARTSSGLVFTGVNVFHFTGGPCAELVALGCAAGAGVLAKDITTMVAVRKDEQGKMSVINPCGRCRQVLLDYNPKMNAIVSDEEGRVRVCQVRSLLPFAYVYKDGDTTDIQEEEEEIAIA